MTGKNRIWLSSDYHINHRNVLKYCDRQFDSIEEMDEAFVRNHNKVVRRNDLFFFLGDLTFHPAAARKVLQKLNGRIHFIWGNHDKKIKKVGRELCEWTGGLKTIRVDKKKITLCHYPLESWDGSHWGHFHFHGHCHATFPEKSNRLDIGIDNAYKLLGEYRPFSLAEAIECLPEREEKERNANRNASSIQSEDT
jgi:calcineurin-like phosphoesterase family protein